MSAAKAIVGAAAPGQFDAVAENLQKLGASGSWLTEAQMELQEFQLKNIQNNFDHPMAKELHEKMEAYQKENFGKPGVSARVVVTNGSSGSELIVLSYAERIETTNLHAGNWKATWTIDSSGSSAEISGKVLVQSYAHEEGNVQLKIDKEFQAVMVSGVDGVVQQITQWETIILGILASMNEDISSDHLRSIRRVLPITKTKMNWDAVAHRSVKTLKQTAPETRSKVKYGN